MENACRETGVVERQLERLDDLLTGCENISRSLNYRLRVPEPQKSSVSICAEDAEKPTLELPVQLETFATRMTRINDMLAALNDDVLAVMGDVKVLG